MKRGVAPPAITIPEPKQFYPPKRGFDFSKKLAQELITWTKKISDVVSTHGQVRGMTPTIVSAPTISLIQEIMHVEGNAAIALLTYPPDFGGAVELIADGPWTLVVVAPPNGNIALAVAPVVGQAVRLTLSPKTQLFYPVG